MNFDTYMQINFLVNYEPYRIWDEYGDKVLNPKFGINEGNILDLKENKQNGITYYSEKLVNDLLENNYNLNDIDIITCVPSSKCNTISEGMIQVAQNYCKHIPNARYISCLYRTCNIEKLATGGNRKIDIHLDSIDIVPNIKNYVNNKNIIILDDITTTGNSLHACKQILQKHGAKKILLVSLGKTVHHD